MPAHFSILKYLCLHISKRLMQNRLSGNFCGQEVWYIWQILKDIHLSPSVFTTWAIRRSSWFYSARFFKFRAIQLVTCGWRKPAVCSCATCNFCISNGRNISFIHLIFFLSTKHSSGSQASCLIQKSKTAVAAPGRDVSGLFTSWTLHTPVILLEWVRTVKVYLSKSMHSPSMWFG